MTDFVESSPAILFWVSAVLLACYCLMDRYERKQRRKQRKQYEQANLLQAQESDQGRQSTP